MVMSYDEESNVYSEEARQDYVDDDAMSPEEEGFMAGYDMEDDEE